MQPIWRIDMLGVLKAQKDDLTITRFRTRRVGLLLAFLAFYRDRHHFRDEVGEMLWPESDPEVIRRNFRQALLSLRHALEPPPLPSGSVLQVNQSRLQINPDILSTDVADFEKFIDEARNAESTEEQYEALIAAVNLYKGELLPGFNEEWVQHERLRMEDLYVAALRNLIDICAQESRIDETIAYLRSALLKEPLNEEWHLMLMQQYLDSGRPTSAVKQYQELEAILRKELNCEPSEDAKKLVKRAAAQGATTAKKRKAPEPPVNMPVPAGIAEVTQPPEKDRPKLRLPVQLTRFYGRKQEIEHARAHLNERKSRLTTFLGPAGTGKTRLSIEVGRKLGEELDWNVWFVPLADFNDASMLPDAILDIMKIRRTGNEDTYEEIEKALSGDRNLLILDNLEHMIDQALPIIRDLLEQVPNCSYLVTSRQSLKLEGEHEIALEPLPIPQESAITSDDNLANLAEYPSVQLFVNRCQSIRPDVQLTANNAEAITTICTRLEGIPLAIEIAAGLSNTFTPAAMVRHLEKRLTALASRRKDISPRHQSLRAAIDYSYDFLEPSLQRFFSALSVFRGGFTIEAAYDVCYLWLQNGTSTNKRKERRHPHDLCLEKLLDLQERSLLRSEDFGNEGLLRFQMLESFREYGEEHLSEEEYQTLRDRHLRYFSSLSKKDTEFTDSEDRLKQHLLTEAEFDNYIAAIDYSLSKRELETSIELLDGLRSTWHVRGPKMVERAYIRQVARLVETKSVSPAHRVLILRMLGTTLLRSSEFSAANSVCYEALQVAQATGSEELLAESYHALSTCAGYQGNMEDCLHYNLKVLEHVPKTNYSMIEGTYLGIGAVYLDQGHIEEAEEAFKKALEIAEKNQGGVYRVLLLYNLAHICLEQGRLDEAMSKIGQAIRISQQLHDDLGLSMCLSLVARYQQLKGNLRAAIATSHQALMKCYQCDFSYWFVRSIRDHAFLVAELKECEVATTLLAATHLLVDNNQLGLTENQAKAIKKMKRTLTAKTFEQAWARGLTMDTDTAFKLAAQYK